MTTTIAPVDLVGVHLDMLALSLGLPKPAREVYCVVGRRYRLDFGWVNTGPGNLGKLLRVGVEYQGGTWSIGAHSTGAGIQRDCEKLALCQIAGWIVVPVTASMVRSGKAIELVEQALRLRMAGRTDV